VFRVVPPEVGPFLTTNTLFYHLIVASVVLERAEVQGRFDRALLDQVRPLLCFRSAVATEARLEVEQVREAA